MSRILDFSRVVLGRALKYIVMFMLVGGITSLLRAKGGDPLDPGHRQSDLLATGVANVVRGGGAGEAQPEACWCTVRCRRIRC